MEATTPQSSFLTKCFKFITQRFSLKSKKIDKPAADICEDFVEITESGANNSNSDKKAKPEDAGEDKRPNNSEEKSDKIEDGGNKNVTDLTPSRRRCYSKEDGDSCNLKARPVKVIYFKQKSSGRMKQPSLNIKFKIHSRPRTQMYNMLKPRTYSIAENDSDGDERMDDGYLSKVCEEYHEIDQNIINLTRSSSNIPKNNEGIHYHKSNKKSHQGNHDLLKDMLRKEFTSCELCKNNENEGKGSISSINSNNIYSNALVEYPICKNSKNHRRKRRHLIRNTELKISNKELDAQNIEPNSNCKEINLNDKFQEGFTENDSVRNSSTEESQDTKSLSTKTFKKYCKINIKKIERKELINKDENKDRKFCSDNYIEEEKVFANNVWVNEESKRFKSSFLDYDRRGDVYGYEYFKIYCSKDDSGDSAKKNRCLEFKEIENPVNLNYLKQCVDKSMKGRLHNNFAQFVENKFRQNKKIVSPGYDSEREDYVRKRFSLSKFGNETNVKDGEKNRFLYNDKKKLEELESRKLWADVKDDLKYEIRKIDSDKAEALINKEIVGTNNYLQCSYDIVNSKYQKNLKEVFYNKKKKNNHKKCKLYRSNEFESNVSNGSIEQCEKLNTINKGQDNCIQNSKSNNFKKKIEDTNPEKENRNSSKETSKNYVSQWKTTRKGYNSTKENQIHDINVRVVDFLRYQTTDSGQVPWYFFKHIESNCSKEWEQLISSNNKK